MKPLDFVVTPEGAFALVTEMTDGGASITFIGEGKGEMNAWWDPSRLKVVDNLPNLLARKTAHPFGKGHKYVDAHFPIGDKK